MENELMLPEKLETWLSEEELVIFLFHGVVSEFVHPVRNYTRKHIDAEMFENCISRLSAKGKALSMDEVLDYCETGSNFPKFSYAITFDDGFENNISIGLPILEKYEVPMMIYLTTRFVDENGMSWIDRIETAVEDSVHELIYFYVTDENYKICNTDEKKYFLNEVRKSVKSNPSIRPDEIADHICEQLIPDSPIISGDNQLDLKLSWSQINELKSHPLMSFGGHSHTHPILSFLSERELSYEIDTSLSLLSTKAAIQPTHYSYPEGLAHCYSDEVINQLKERGVRCCPTAIEGKNNRGANPFELRRVMVV